MYQNFLLRLNNIIYLYTTFCASIHPSVAIAGISILDFLRFDEEKSLDSEDGGFYGLLLSRPWGSRPPFAQPSLAVTESRASQPQSTTGHIRFF